MLENVESFADTFFYVGLSSHKDTLYVTLNAYHVFLSKLDDEDIAEVIDSYLFNMVMGLGLNGDPTKSIQPLAFRQN